jgi:hypothetical protein
MTHWGEIVDAAAAIGVPEIRISGGEPLAWPEIESMCRAVRGRGMRYTITTNGSLLQRHLEWLANEPPETLWISYHREYRSIDSFLEVVREAVRILPRVGVNVFGTDWDDSFAAAGMQRLKLLTQNAVGRATLASGYDPPALHDTGTAEVRVSAPHRSLGTPSCVLADRPLLSVDGDGRAYACCVTLGTPGAEMGDLQRESLASIAARITRPLSVLPCAPLLPGIAAGKEGCPLRLHANV